MLEDLLGRALLGDLSAVHEEHARADLSGKAHLVRDDDHRDAVAGEVGDDLQHLADHLGVERGGRLIEEQHIGLHRQRPHDGDTLLLPAGELGGIGVRLVLKPHAL